MKKRFHILAPILLGLLWFNPSQAVTDYREANELMRATLPSEDDFLPLLADKTQKAELQSAIDAPETTREFDAFWGPEKNWFRIAYKCTMSDIGEVTSMLTIAKDDKAAKETILEIARTFNSEAEAIGAEFVPIDIVANSPEKSKYYLLVHKKEGRIGNTFIVSRGKNILIVSIAGGLILEKEEIIDSFLSKKIDKALSFQPDQKFPNYPLK